MDCEGEEMVQNDDSDVVENEDDETETDTETINTNN